MQLIFDAENTTIGIENKMTSVDHTSVSEKFEDVVMTESKVELDDEIKTTAITSNGKCEKVQPQEDKIDEKNSVSGKVTNETNEANSIDDDVKVDSEKKVVDVSANDNSHAALTELQEILDETKSITVDEVDKATKSDLEMIDKSPSVTDTTKSKEVIDKTETIADKVETGIVNEVITNKTEPDAANEIANNTNEHTNLSSVEVNNANIEISADTVKTDSIAENNMEKDDSEEELSFNSLMKLEKGSNEATSNESDKYITTSIECLQGAGDTKKIDAKELIDYNVVDTEMVVEKTDDQSNQENSMKTDSIADDSKKSSPEIVIEAPTKISPRDIIDKMEVDKPDLNDTVAKEIEKDSVKIDDDDLVKSTEESEKEDYSMSIDEFIDETEPIKECIEHGAEIATEKPAETDSSKTNTQNAEIELEKTTESDPAEPSKITVDENLSQNIIEDVNVRSRSESSITVSETKEDTESPPEKVSSDVSVDETKLIDKFVAEESDASAYETSSSQISSSSTSKIDFAVSDVRKTSSNEDIVNTKITKSSCDDDINVTELSKANDVFEETEVTKREDIVVTEITKSSSNDDIDVCEVTEVTKSSNVDIQLTEVTESTAVEVTETQVTKTTTNTVILVTEVAKSASKDESAVSEVTRTRTSSNETIVLEDIKTEKIFKQEESQKSETKPDARKDAFRLNNTLDILSDDEEDRTKKVVTANEKVLDKGSEEKQTINIDDDDDIMLIDDDTNVKEDDKVQAQEPPRDETEVAMETVDLDPKEPEIIEPSKDKEPIEVPVEKGEAPRIDEPKEVDLEPKEIRKSLVPDNFFKTYKKNLTDMTRDDLEEFCILKIVESIIDRSSLNETKTKLKLANQTVDELKKKHASLAKQNRDLQVVLKSVQEEQKKNSNTITPLKITRSVGMQVLMSEGKMKRKMVIPPQQASNSNNTPSSVKKVAKPRPQKQTTPQPIPVPRLVPATNIKSPIQNANTANPVKSPITNGVKLLPAVKAEKRTHSRMQSVTVDLTDDEPPAKVLNKSPAAPVRLVPSQNLLARQPNNNYPQGTSPRKVFIPISGTQSHLRPGQTIMVKSVAPSQAQRPRHPAPIRLPQNVPRLPRAQGRHPAPLPDAMKQYQPPNWKALPPAPDLKLSKVENGIVISWKIEGYQEDSYEEIASYQLFAYQETSLPPSTNLWKKIGDVKALPLPMACTLTQFMAGYKYYFAVRAVDIRSRLGPFSLPGSILLLNKM